MSFQDLKSTLADWKEDGDRFRSSLWAMATCPYLLQTGDRLCAGSCYQEPECLTGGVDLGDGPRFRSARLIRVEWFVRSWWDLFQVVRMNLDILADEVRR